MREKPWGLSLFSPVHFLGHADYIQQGGYLSKLKSVYITDVSKAWAKELQEKYGIENWEPE